MPVGIHQPEHDLWRRSRGADKRNVLPGRPYYVGVQLHAGAPYARRARRHHLHRPLKNARGGSHHLH